MLEVLEPYSVEQGGPLIIQHVSFVEGRGNIIVEYPGTDASAGVVSFVGCHMDVVTANPDTWEFDPFKVQPLSCFFFVVCGTRCLDGVQDLSITRVRNP